MNNLTPQEQATVELVQQYQRRRFSRRDFLGKALALGLTLPAAASLLAACGDNTATSAPANSGAATSATTAAAAPSGPPTKMIVMGNGAVLGDTLKSELIAPFEKKYNTKIEYVVSQTTEQLTRLRAEKDSPTVDFIFTGEAVAVTMRGEGLLEKMDAAKVPNMSKVVDAFKNDAGYAPISGAYANMPLWNKAKVSQPLTGWADLWRPELKEGVSFPDITNTTGLLFLILAAQINGGGIDNMDPGFAAMVKLKPNFHPSTGWAGIGSDQVNLTKQGDISALVTFIGLARPAKEEQGSPVEFSASLKEGYPPSPLTLGIVKGTKNLDLVHNLINEVLTDNVQLALASKASVSPCTTVKLPADLEKIVPAASTMQKLDWQKIAAARPGWTERWGKEVIAKK
jgi:putative spermidine/putrescine transport system substrate-binding protein